MFLLINYLYCIIHIQNQAKQIEKLTQKNEEFIESISKLNLDIAKYGEKINTINLTTYIYTFRFITFKTY